jgi:excisionase family DNA binding protein
VTRSPTADPELATLTIPECARQLQVSSSLLYRLAKRGELPGAIFLGSAVRVHRTSFLRWLETRGRQHVNGTGGTAPTV